MELSAANTVLILQGVKHENATSPPPTRYTYTSFWSSYNRLILAYLLNAFTWEHQHVLTISWSSLAAPMNSSLWDLWCLSTRSTSLSNRKRYEIHANQNPLDPSSRRAAAPLFLPAEHRSAEKSWQIYDTQLPCTEWCVHPEWGKGKACSEHTNDKESKVYGLIYAETWYAWMQWPRILCLF